MPTLVYMPMRPSYILLFIQFLIVKHFRMISILYLNGPPELNPDKSVYMRITHKHNPVLYNYTIDNTTIQQVSSTKYLGITITNDLTSSTYINKITSKALSTKAFLQRNLRFCPAHVKLKCYNIMIRPILEYACPVWSPHPRNNLNKYRDSSLDSLWPIIPTLVVFPTCSPI